MELNKFKKTILILMLGIVAFLINNGDVYAADTTCTYSVLNGKCSLKYTVTPDGRESANVSGGQIDCGSSGTNLQFASGGDMLTSNNFVDDGAKTIGCPSILYYQVGYNQAGRYTFLKASASKFNGSLGTIPLSSSSNNPQSIAAKQNDPNAVRLLRTCSVTGKSVTGTGGSSNINVKVYSDGTLDFEAINGNYNIVTNGISYDMFKDSCPSGIVLQCGGDGSNSVCNLTTPENVVGDNGQQTTETTDLAEQEKINTNSPDFGDDVSVGCEGILGEELLDTIQEIFNWIKIAVPIIVIVLGSLDFGKAVLIEDKDDLSKATNKFIKRCIIAVVIFFIPTILNYLLGAFNAWSKSNISTCRIR